MSESEYSEKWFRVKDILDIYYNDITFMPPVQDWSWELNPTHDRLKTKILREDRRVQWRLCVAKSIREQKELYCWEIVWRRRYMTQTEAFWFWTYYVHGKPWRYEVGEAIKKVDRNFAKKYVYWE